MSQAGTDEDVRVEEIGGSAGTEDTGNATERTENGTKEGPTEQLVNGVAPEELSEEQEALQNGEGQIMNDEGLATEDKQKICEGKDKSEDSNTVDSDAGDTDTVNLLSESVELSKSVEGGNDREGNGDNVSMNGVLPNGSVDLASDTLTDIESAKTDCDNLKDNGEDEGDETLHISVEENKIESEPLSREDSNLNSEDRKDDLQQVKVARRHRLSRSRSASTNSRKSLPDASEVKESPTSEKIDKRKRRLKKVNGDVSEGSGTKTDVVQSSNNEKTLHKEEVIKNSADVVKINKRKSSIKSTEEKVASKASSAPLDNIDLAILDVIERARNNEDFKLENGIPNDVPRYAKLNLGSKRASIGKSQTSPVISRKASRGRSPRSPMNVSVKSPLVKGQSKSPGKSPGRGKKRRFSTNRQRKASDISASIKTEETVEYSDSKAERKLVRKSSGEVVLSPPPVTSPKQLASPQKRMEQILKGSSPAGRGGGTASRGRKSFSPVSDPKGLGGFRGKRGPRAKMSLSPNHLNTVTIDSFFQPVTAKKPVAKKTLSYATPRKVKKEKIEPCTISSDAAAKALSALSTDLTPSKIPASESSDVENNPAVSSLVRESKMPKARKSFPRSKESSPADVDERLAGNTPSTGQKSSTSKESPSTKPSTNSSSVPMTFKLQELESVFGIKNKSLGKLDAKTLDKIVLDRAQECKKSNPASGIKPEEALPKMQSGVYGNDVTSQLTVAYAKSNAAVTAAVTADPNFASLLTRQKILKKRRPMGKYKLPGNKKKQKKKPKDAITPSKQDMNSKPQAEGSDTAQNGIPHEEPLNIDSKNSSQDIVVNGEDESESVEDDTNASRKVVDSSLDSKDVSPSKRKTGSCSELKLTICANNETGQFTVHTPGSDKSKSPRIPSPGKVQNKISDNEFVDDDEDKDSALGLQAQPTRRSYIRRGRGGYRRRRNWAMGVIPKQKVKPKDGGVQSKVSESKTDLSHESSASLTLPIGHLDADSPSPQPGNKRKWANSGQKSTKVSILASKTPDKSTPTEQKLSRSSKRKKPVSLPACDQAVADDDTIPALSLVDTSLPAGRRESLENAEPPQISPQKVVGTSMFFEHNKPSPTKRLRMQRDTSTPSDAQASPSPPGTTYQRASVCLGAVPGEIQYKIEGARVSHHQQQGGQPGIGRRRRELHGDVAPQRFHNTPNGVTYPVTPPRTPEDGSLAGEDSHTASPEVDPKGADRAPDYLPVCCCRLTGVKMTNNIPVSSKQPLFCQALDSVNNKIVACPLRVSCSQLVRPALAIPFMVLCEAHRGRLKLHQCCPGCGQFCTEGKFIECESEKKEGSRPVHHHYHRHCQTYRANKYFCPHCGKEATQNETHLKLSSSSSAVLVHVSPAPTLGPASTTDMPPALPLSRTARMGSVSSRRDSATSGADSTGGDGISVGVPATDARIHTKKLVGPSRKELEYAILTLDGDRAKKLRAGAKNLFRACRVGDTEKVLVLLADGADPNKRYEEDDHQVALHAAATSGHDLLVHVLLQAGANHHCADAGLRTPLMCAAEGGHLGVLRALARVGAQVNAKGSDGMSSIHLAAQAGKVDAVRFLLETGKTGVNVKDDGGWTPLIWAAEHSHIEVVHYLLHSGADPNIKDNEGNTALHWAAFSGSVDIAEIFLNADCDLESINELGDRPLHIAARQDHYETVVLLLARGADVEARNNANEAPISILPDADPETDEHFHVNLTSVTRLPTDAEHDLSPRLSTVAPVATVTIRSSNDPLGVFSLTVDGGEYIGKAEPSRVTLTISRTGGVFGSVTVRVRTVGGGEPWDAAISPSTGGLVADTIAQALGGRDEARRALVGQDYERLDTEVVFEPGVNQKKVSVLIMDDAQSEDEETLFVYLDLQMEGARVARPSTDNGKKGFVQMNIRRNDFWNGFLGFSLINSTRVDIDEDSGKPVTLTVERQNASYGNLRVNWRAIAEPGVALPQSARINLADQLEATTGSVQCAASAKYCSFDVQLKQDQIPENATWFLVDLYLSGSPSQEGATIDENRRYANITVVPSDNPNGLIQWAQTSRLVYISLTTSSVELRVERAGYTSKPVTVRYRTRQLAGTTRSVAGVSVYSARQGADYDGQQGLINFSPGQVDSTVTLTLDPQKASDVSYPKTFDVILEGATSLAQLGESVSSVTIADLADVMVWDLWPLAQRQLNNNSIIRLMSEVERTVANDLTEPQLSIVKATLEAAIEAAETHPLQLSASAAVLSAFCRLLAPGRTDAVRGHWQLAGIMERFVYSLLTGRGCTDDFIQSSSCVHARYAVANMYPEEINTYKYTSKSQDYFAMPSNLLRVADHGRQSTHPKCYPVAFIEYSSDVWFPQTEKLLNNKVLSASVKDGKHDLSEPVRFRINAAGNTKPSANSKCVYLDESRQQWSPSVCLVDNNRTLGVDGYVTCACVHLSVYAVSEGVPEPVQETPAYPMYFYIACSITIACMALAVLSHHACHLTTMFTADLIMHMCFSVLATEVCYVIAAALSPRHLLAIAPDDDNYRCIVMALFTHYFYLTQFTWMMTQSINLFKILVLNDENTTRKYITYFFVGWGLPLLLVAIFYAVTYVIYQYLFTHIDPKYIYGDVLGTKDICFITNAYAGLAGVVAPSLICLMVVGVVFIQAFQITPQWQYYDDIYRGRYNRNEVRFLLVFFGLLVLTWLWGGLHLAYGQPWMLIIFCIFNIAMGVYVLVLYMIVRIPCLNCFKPQKAVVSDSNNTMTTATVTTSPGLDSRRYDTRVHYDTRTNSMVAESLKGSRQVVLHPEEQPWEKETIVAPPHQPVMSTNSLLRVKRAPATAAMTTSPSHHSNNIYILPPGSGHRGPPAVRLDDDDSQNLDDLILALRTGAVPVTTTPSDASYPGDTTGITTATDSSVHGGLYERRRPGIADTHL